MAVGAFAFFGGGSVGDVFFECAHHAVFPGVDGVAVEHQVAHDVHHVWQRHSVSQDSGDQLGVVPVFFVELARQALHGDFESLHVLKLKVVARGVLFFVFDYPAFGNPLGHEETLGFTCKYFVRPVVEQSDDGYPFLVAVAEPHHIGFEFLRAGWRLCFSEFVPGVVFVADQHALARAVAVDGHPFAAAFPGCHVNIAD